jgi:hypothetical protein
VNFLPANFSSAFFCATSRLAPETHFDESILCDPSSVLEIPFTRRDTRTNVFNLALDFDVVSGSTMTPPQLPRDAPILYPSQPALPLFRRRARLDLEQLVGVRSTCCFGFFRSCRVLLRSLW